MQSWLRGCWSLGSPLVDKELRDVQAAHVHMHHYILIFRLRIIHIIRQIFIQIRRRRFRKI